MVIDGETSQMRPGDAVLIPPGAWHTLENNGTSELRILCCCAPPYSHDDTFFE
jgi:mannose-6-phosphate isomerase-like protein (cupin superfamily)